MREGLYSVTVRLASGEKRVFLMAAGSLTDAAAKAQEGGLEVLAVRRGTGAGVDALKSTPESVAHRVRLRGRLAMALMLMAGAVAIAAVLVLSNR